MPFCPICRYEFIEGIKTCNDCGVGLVDELPEEAEEAEEEEYQGEWLKVLNVSSNEEAEMLAGLLRSSGIPVTTSSFVNDVLTFRYPRGVDILVPEEYSRQAAEVMAAFSGAYSGNMADGEGELQQVEENTVVTETNVNNGSMRKIIIIAVVILAFFIMLTRAEGLIELVISLVSGSFSN